MVSPTFGVDAMKEVLTNEWQSDQQLRDALVASGTLTDPLPSLNESKLHFVKLAGEDDSIERKGVEFEFRHRQPERIEGPVPPPPPDNADANGNGAKDPPQNRERQSNLLTRLIEVNAELDFPERFRESEEDLRKVPDNDLFRKLNTAKGILQCAQHFKEGFRQSGELIAILTAERDERPKKEELQEAFEVITNLRTAAAAKEVELRSVSAERDTIKEEKEKLQISLESALPAKPSLKKSKWVSMAKWTAIVFVIGFAVYIPQIQSYFRQSEETVTKPEGAKMNGTADKKTSLQRALDEYDNITTKE